MKEVTLSEVIAQIKLGKAKGEIKEIFALTAGQYKQLMNHPQVIACFESIKAEKQALKEAKKNRNKLVIVDDLAEQSANTGEWVDSIPETANTFETPNGEPLEETSNNSY